MRILYLDLDCVRPDHLGCYGYARRTSPNIDHIAWGGVSFDHCYCSDSPCMPSRASLFSGQFGFNNGVVGHHDIGSRFRYERLYGHGQEADRAMLAMHLWRHGMKTVTFSSFHDRHRAWWFTAGWEEVHTFTRKRGSERADEANAAFLPWLRQHAREDNWFIHLHYWDAHSEYRVPPEWVERFRDQPGPDWPDQATIDGQQSFYGPCTGTDLFSAWEADGVPGSGDCSFVPYMPDAIRTEQDLKELIDGYDASIAYLDDHIGQVLEVLDEAGVLAETAIIVSGDHGDAFGEHGHYLDHCIANEAIHHVPMIVRWPGVTAGPSQCEALVYGLDLGPTLCELLGLPAPGQWDGHSFAAALRGEDFPGWPYQVWGHGLYTITRTVRTPEWEMIRILHPGVFPYSDPIMLHNMRDDPHQTINLAQQRPDVVGELMVLMEDWRQAQIRKGSAPDPLEQMVSVGPFMCYTPEQMMRRLARTGRGHLIPGLKVRLNRYHPGRYA